MPIITISAQGRVLEVKVEYPVRAGRHVPRGTSAHRGDVHGLSRAARSRLMKLLNKVAWGESHNKFITLTYPADFPTVDVSKDHLRAFLERVRRAHPDAAVIWKLEFQKRGAPHYHLVSPNLPFQNKCSIQSMWGEIIGYEDVFTRIDAFDGKEILKYVAKYVSKPAREREEDKSVQICDTIKTREKGPAWTGRCWGVHNRSALPMHSRFQTVSADYSVYQNIRSLSTERWPRLAEFADGSFTLYVDEAAKFAGLLS